MKNVDSKSLIMSMCTVVRDYLKKGNKFKFVLYLVLSHRAAAWSAVGRSLARSRRHQMGRPAVRRGMWDVTVCAVQCEAVQRLCPRTVEWGLIDLLKIFLTEKLLLNLS